MSSFTKLIDSEDDGINLGRTGDTGYIHLEPRSLTGILKKETAILKVKNRKNWNNCPVRHQTKEWNNCDFLGENPLLFFVLGWTLKISTTSLIWKH